MYVIREERDAKRGLGLQAAVHRRQEKESKMHKTSRMILSL